MILVADNLHVVDPVVARALGNLDAAPIQDLVRRCQLAGAQAIDINSGPLVKEPEKYFAFLVETVQQTTSLPLLLDTTNARALEAGLSVCRLPAIINGFSLEPGKLKNILPLAAKFDAHIIGYLLGPNSEVPIDEEEMLTLALSLYEAFCAAGLPAEQLIIDPVIAPLTWENGMRHNQAVLKVIRHLPDVLGFPVRTIAGVSNLASGPVPLARKIEVEQAYLPMLASAGLDFALLNIFHEPTVVTATTCSALMGDKIFTWQR